MSIAGVYALHLVIFITFFIILLMKKDFSIKQYVDLFTEYPKDSLFLNLQKKLSKLLKSLELKDKHIILAVS
jgi:hypothetical protein